MTTELTSALNAAKKVLSRPYYFKFAIFTGAIGAFFTGAFLVMTAFRQPNGVDWAGILGILVFVGLFVFSILAVTLLVFVLAAVLRSFCSPLFSSYLTPGKDFLFICLAFALPALFRPLASEFYYPIIHCGIPGLILLFGSPIVMRLPR